MKKSILAGALWATCVIAPVHAENNDAMWQSASAQLEASRKWAADVIDLTGDVDRGSGVRGWSATMRLSGWDKQKPVYSVVNKQSDVKGFGLKFLNGVTAASVAIAEGETPARTDGIVLDGVACTVFEIHASAALTKVAMKLWVDAGTSKPLQMVVSFHLPLTADGTVITHYVTNAQGQILPVVVDYDLNILTPFNKAKTRIHQTSSGWVALPSDPGR
ncbi:hypothetical protein GTP81_18415 [Rugamonas sp. FT107W]|uniref:Outer membrane lipoprotein-sorting protein n=1 Tax=Duganella vulcania TaxID=2692166 RepID=A0A845HK03_9BURK|nr:hypothetical protein [Duganella vulcania]MYN18727.1 hypothetical protein [Duganella vulcania]